ncbi:hypothetical protein ES705_29927 [subsurface metagenome]
MQQAIDTTLWAIEKAYRNREIDLDTKLILKVKALQEPGSVPGKYKPIEYVKEKLELKYHQDDFKRVLREVRERWLETRIETHSEIWSSRIFSYLKEYIREDVKREQEMFGYEFMWIPPDDAYIMKEIDLDQMMLYRYGPPEEWPARFIPPKPTRVPHPFFRDKKPSPWEERLPLVRYSRYLRPETGVGIEIDSPKEAVGGFSWGIGYPEKEKQGGLKVYTPTVKIKGKIVTPEMYEEVEAWVVVRADGRLSFPVDESGEVKEMRKEIRLGLPTYEKPKLDEKAFKEKYEKWTEGSAGGKVEVDQFAMEYWRGPGKIIRRFEIELKLPYYIGNVITISARNNGGQSASTGLYVTRYDRTDKERPKVKIKRPKDGAVLTRGGYRMKNEILLPVYCEATDNRKILKIAVYSNEKLGGETFITDRTHIGYDKDGKSIWADYYRVDVPIRIGKNKIKAIAYDIGGSSKSDTVKIIYSPEKR